MSPHPLYVAGSIATCGLPQTLKAIQSTIKLSTESIDDAFYSPVSDAEPGIESFGAVMAVSLLSGLAVAQASVPVYTAMKLLDYL